MAARDPAPVEAGARLDGGRLLLGGLVYLALQRALRRDRQQTRLDTAGEAALGHSFGLAPLLALHRGAAGTSDTARAYAACLPDDEALWLGLHVRYPARNADVRVSAVRAGEGPHLRARASVPPAYALTDPPGGAAASPIPHLFSDPPCCLLVRACRTPVRLLLLAPAAYSAATGARPPAPLRLENAYRGWRLP